MSKLSSHSQQGATLIEILVSMIVLSLGLLGYAGLIVKSQSYNTTAHFRSQATILANSIIESARANKAALASYVCSTPCASSGLDTSTVAGADLTLFSKGVEALPEGKSSIAIGIDNKVTVTVTWNNADTDSNGANTTSSFVTETWIK